MLSIAILGCDSSHTEAFCGVIHDKNGPFQDKCRVTTIWGEDFSQAKEKSEALGVENVFENMADALENVDAAMVLGRFPESHFEPALCSVKKGLPVFIDKPFFSSEDVANSFMEKVGADNAIFSCSIYRFCKQVQFLKSEMSKYKPVSMMFTGPLECNDLGDDSRFKELSFYGIHSIDPVLELLGDDVEDISVISNDVGKMISLKFGHGSNVCINLMRDMQEEFYQVFLTSAEKRVSFDIELEEEIYMRTFQYIYDFFQTRKSPVDVKSNLMALRIIDKAN